MAPWTQRKPAPLPGAGEVGEGEEAIAGAAVAVGAVVEELEVGAKAVAVGALEPAGQHVVVGRGAQLEGQADGAGAGQAALADRDWPRWSWRQGR